jgi:hypothetical protein
MPEPSPQLSGRASGLRPEFRASDQFEPLVPVAPSMTEADVIGALREVKTRPAPIARQSEWLRWTRFCPVGWPVTYLHGDLTRHRCSLSRWSPCRLGFAVRQHRCCPTGYPGSALAARPRPFRSSADGRLDARDNQDEQKELILDANRGVILVPQPRHATSLATAGHACYRAID